MSKLPPKWAERFINWLTMDGQHEDIPGDLQEEFAENKLKKGVSYARLKYVWTVLRCLRPFILQDKFNFKLNQAIMIRNYWLVTRRFILKNKLYAAINILGLAIGIGCSLVLLIYVSNELGFDRFHKGGENIYRLVVTTSKSQEGESTTATITAAIAPTLKEELPEVIEFMRFSAPTNGFLSFDEKKINIEKLVYADSSLFNVFTFELEEGDMQSSLTMPYSILLTPQIARSLFGDENPIGRQVMLNGEKSLLVTGIIKDAPTNSQIQYSCLVSFSTLKKEGYFLDWNGGWNYFSYVKLAPKSDIAALQRKFPALMDRHINNMLKQFQVEWQLNIQPLRDVHLGSIVEGNWSIKLQYIYIFGSIAIITLLMAIVNFINLTASQSITRMKEIGVRKSLGANKKMLVYQFLFESLIFTLIAMCLAILLIAVFSNTISGFLGYQFDQMYLNNFWLALIIGVLILIVSIGSGAYPAFFLSSLSSINSLKNNLGKGLSAKPKEVDVLVIFQFAISIMLIAGTWFINDQLGYIQGKGLGYAKENVLVVTLNSEQASKNIENLKIELARIPEVIDTGASTDLPGDGYTSNGYVPEGQELPIMLHALDIDDTYLKTMGMDIVSGRSFSNDIISDKLAFLVNETLAIEMGWKDAVGKIISRGGDHKVIGVVKDFNYASLHDKIEPLVFTMAPWKDQYNFLSIRIEKQNISSTIKKIEQAWNMVNVNDPLEYSFLDQEFDSLYYKEQQQAKLLFIFSVLAILIGSMGLFGIVSYSLKQKTKEIGVRKVLGATALNLLAEISKRYIFSIIIASAVAIPIVYIFIDKWLGNFYYRIEIKSIIFLLSVLIAFIIALITINVQTVAAIKQNPTESLKYE